MVVKEPRGIVVHRDRLVVDSGRMLMCRGTPVLMLLVLTILFAHDPRLSPD